MSYPQHSRPELPGERCESVRDGYRCQLLAHTDEDDSHIACEHFDVTTKPVAMYRWWGTGTPSVQRGYPAPDGLRWAPTFPRDETQKLSATRRS